MRPFPTLLLSLLAAAASAEESPTYSGWTRQWQATFPGAAGTQINTDNWNIKTGANANNEWQRYTTSTSNMQLSGGQTLQIIPRKDAAILANCPDRAVRRRWLRRIVDHDGTVDGEGGIEAWLRLGEAAGLSRAEMADERHVVPGVRFAVDAYVTFARTRPWVEAVASSLTELFAPKIHKERISGMLENYDFINESVMAYFKRRLVQAPRDT